MAGVGGSVGLCTGHCAEAIVPERRKERSARNCRARKILWGRLATCAPVGNRRPGFAASEHPPTTRARIGAATVRERVASSAGVRSVLNEYDQLRDITSSRAPFP